jgi:O-antigen/teichoic acid export membrane protein
LVTLFLTSADKILLSKILSLKEFGYYSLAFTLSNALSILAFPITTALFPRLSTIAALKDEGQLSQTYRFACRLVASVIAPAGAMMVIFAPDILTVWVHRDNASHAQWILRMLASGTVINSLLLVPSLLAVACGWVSFGFIQNLVSCFFLMPLLWFLGTRYGGPGAALVWVILNLAQMIISIPILHAKLMPGQSGRWYRNSLSPCLVAFSTGETFWLMKEHWHVDVARPGCLLLIGSIVAVATLTENGSVRSYFKNKVQR